MALRKKRTAAEIEASIARSKKILAEEKKDDELYEVRKGRNYIFGVAVLMAISGAVDYAMSDVIEVFYFYGPVIVIYVLLGIYFYRNPVVISMVALGLFILLHVLFAILDPVNIARGIIVKILVITALISAIKKAKKYKDELAKMNRPKAEDDVLDAEFIG